MWMHAVQNDNDEQRDKLSIQWGDSLYLNERNKKQQQQLQY